MAGGMHFVHGLPESSKELALVLHVGGNLEIFKYLGPFSFTSNIRSSSSIFEHLIFKGDKEISFSIPFRAFKGRRPFPFQTISLIQKKKCLKEHYLAVVVIFAGFSPLK